MEPITIEDIQKYASTNTPFLDAVYTASMADEQYKHIMEQIKEFEKTLDNEHEVALLLTNFGQSVQLNVTNISYQNPYLIYYYGTVDGNECQLIQHVSQINFLLKAVDKETLSRPARRIGFAVVEE